MNRRRLITVMFGAASLGLAAVFTSLGFWQLRRLAERRAQNATLASRRFHAPIVLSDAARDTGSARFSRVRISGAYDYSREFALTLRTRNGSPGVDIITPVVRGGTDTLVLVNRGWIYAPDGMTADISKWAEGDSVNAIGFVETYPPAPGAYASQSPGRARAYRWLDRLVLEKDLHQPVAPYYVVLAPDSETGYAPSVPMDPRVRVKEKPPRVEPRGLDEGPHKSYAIQWFSFAAISILGLIFFLRRS